MFRPVKKKKRPKFLLANRNGVDVYDLIDQIWRHNNFRGLENSSRKRSA